LRPSSREGAPPFRRPPATKWPRDSVTPSTLALGRIQRIAGVAYVQRVEHYLTAAVTALVVAIVFSLTAIFVRSVVAMDGKLAADGTALELRKSQP
jgi:hypothetical protein